MWQCGVEDWAEHIEYNDGVITVHSDTAQMWFNFYVQELKFQEIEERVNRLYEMFKEQEKK